MRSPEKQLQALGFILPQVPVPVGNFSPFVRHHDLLFLSGQGPLLEDGSLAQGKVGVDVSMEQAYVHARRTGLVLLAAMREALGSLDRVERIVKILGMVNASPDFSDHPGVINGCSDLFVEIFADRGRHARSAVGMGSLPGGITVEIEAIVAVRLE
ncbi:MAG: RidA family protein [Deltaproteobacteria bacterium]|jgi:enamine deaminase RidA (YjgF/YER057c/UK114 family)|nr:RidA family protein [Deltaproteobacteria bacterium]